jgi:hypothetical protein
VSRRDETASSSRRNKASRTTWCAARSGGANLVAIGSVSRIVARRGETYLQILSRDPTVFLLVGLPTAGIDPTRRHGTSDKTEGLGCRPCAWESM